MRVLIACESSGVTRDAFLALGHEVMSCDLLPTVVPGPHYEGDVRDVLAQPWDMVIAHPTCTYLHLPELQWPALEHTTRGCCHQPRRPDRRCHQVCPHVH